MLPVCVCVCRSPSPSAAASRAPSMLGAALSAVAAAASSSQPAATANGSLAGAAEPQAAAAQGSSRADSQPPSVKPGLLSPRPRTSSPVGIPGKAANGAGSGGGGGGGSGGGVEAALSNFSNTVTGWGRNLLNGSMVDSLSSNEGIKALVAGGSWGSCCADLTCICAAGDSSSLAQTPVCCACCCQGVPGPTLSQSHRASSVSQCSGGVAAVSASTAAPVLLLRLVHTHRFLVQAIIIKRRRPGPRQRSSSGSRWRGCCAAQQCRLCPRRPWSCPQPLPHLQLHCCDGPLRPQHHRGLRPTAHSRQQQHTAARPAPVG